MNTMTNCLVVTGNTFVGPSLISIYSGTLAGVCAYKALESLCIRCFNDLSPNLVSLTIFDTNNGNFPLLFTSDLLICMA